jgi:hypothetical protein
MGFWSDTFGDGNSFSESVANVTTPKDNYEYIGGDLYEKGSSSPYAGDNTATNYGTLGQADNRYTGAAYNEDTNANPNFQNVTSGGSTRSNNAALYEAPVVPQGSGRPTTMQRVIPGLALGAAGFGPLAMGAAMYRGLGSNQYGVPEFKSPNDEYATTQDEIERAVAKANATKMTTAGMGEGKSFFGGKRGPDGYTSDIRTAGEPHDRIRGAFFKKDDPSGRAYKINAFGNSYEVDTDGQNIGNSSQIRRDAEAAALPDDGGGVAGLRYTPRTQATVPTSTMPAMSEMSREAAAGANMPIPNPNYDPNDPTSMKYIINPTYDQIVAYKRGLPGYTPVEPDSSMSAEMIQAIKNGTLGKVFGYAEGGEVESALGGNEKDLINDAEKAIRGELDETRASIVLAQYVQQYGEDALRDLVDSVRTGSAQETRDRFARGDNGYVNGNGDGSGTDDKVPAKLKEGDSEQDVLLATKEFVFKESAATALENAGVSLDKINDAGANAPKVLREYFTG